MSTNEEERYSIVSAHPYPIKPRMMGAIEMHNAEGFIDTVARIDRSGECFAYLCSLLGEVRYWRSLDEKPE